MIELIQHIEKLLSENDCVIIPDFGGFIVHYTSASYAEKEHLFLPPARIIGFNPQLRINDGLLIQSYMSAYNISFSDATQIVNNELAKLVTILHKEGKITLNNIGEIHYTINGQYEFTPNNNTTVPIAFYGLAPFEIEKLNSIDKGKRIALSENSPITKKKTVHNIEHIFLRNAVAIAAIFILFFAFSIPIKNTDISDNYAQLLPKELFEQIEEKTIITSQKISRPHNVLQQSKTIDILSQKENKIAVNESLAKEPIDIGKQNNTTATFNKTNKDTLFHIIVAGGISKKDAENMVNDLKEKGFGEATVLNNNGKIRVSIRSFDNHANAIKELIELRKNQSYQTAWLLTPQK